MLTIILAESEIEIIPKVIQNHPSILSYAKKFNKKLDNIILDSSNHHNAMKNLQEFERRGRPDIIHIFLLSVLESIVNKKCLLKIIVHTRNNEVIYVNPKTRMIKNYHRFLGLFEKLFQKKIISSNNHNLLELKEKTPLKKIIEEEKHDLLIVFSQKGKVTNLTKYFTNLKNNGYNDILCVIGGFPHGEFHFDFSKYNNETISIFEENLTVLTVTNELLINFENIYCL